MHHKMASVGISDRFYANPAVPKVCLQFSRCFEGKFSATLILRGLKSEFHACFLMIFDNFLLTNYTYFMTIKDYSSWYKVFNPRKFFFFLHKSS
uniref:Dendritic cell-specific transmembrane protein-like domain-containing protein n=1 Tax=Parascaris univalens TaxID=6257 RepID=A0A914ZXC4_PARUN